MTIGVTLCVCPPSRSQDVSTARGIGLGDEGNALYPMLSSSGFVMMVWKMLSQNFTGEFYKSAS